MIRYCTSVAVITFLSLIALGEATKTCPNFNPSLSGLSGSSCGSWDRETVQCGETISNKKVVLSQNLKCDKSGQTITLKGEDALLDCQGNTIQGPTNADNGDVIIRLEDGASVVNCNFIAGFHAIETVGDGCFTINNAIASYAKYHSFKIRNTGTTIMNDISSTGSNKDGINVQLIDGRLDFELKDYYSFGEHEDGIHLMTPRSGGEVTAKLFGKISIKSPEDHGLNVQCGNKVEIFGDFEAIGSAQQNGIFVDRIPRCDASVTFKDGSTGEICYNNILDAYKVSVDNGAIVACEESDRRTDCTSSCFITNFDPPTSTNTATTTTQAPTTTSTTITTTDTTTAPPSSTESAICSNSIPDVSGSSGGSCGSWTQQSVQCGDSITDKKVVLSQNLKCDSPGQTITLSGSDAFLDCQGYTIQGATNAQEGDVILYLVNGASVANCNFIAGYHAIETVGDGCFKINNITVSYAKFDSYRIWNTGTTFMKDISSTGANRDGINVQLRDGGSLDFELYNYISFGEHEDGMDFNEARGGGEVTAKLYGEISIKSPEDHGIQVHCGNKVEIYGNFEAIGSAHQSGISVVREFGCDASATFKGGSNGEICYNDIYDTYDIDVENGAIVACDQDSGDVCTSSCFVTSFDPPTSTNTATTTTQAPTTTTDAVETTTATLIDFATFGSGNSGWEDGGNDAMRMRDANCPGDDSYCFILRDNSGVDSSIIKSFSGVSGYDALQVRFKFRAVSMERGEKFYLEFDNGFSDYNIVWSWTSPSSSDYVDEEVRNESVLIPFIPSPDPTVYLRFRCDASSNTDYIFVDDIEVSGIDY